MACEDSDESRTELLLKIFHLFIVSQFWRKVRVNSEMQREWGKNKITYHSLFKKTLIMFIYFSLRELWYFYSLLFEGKLLWYIRKHRDQKAYICFCCLLVLVFFILCANLKRCQEKMWPLYVFTLPVDFQRALTVNDNLCNIDFAKKASQRVFQKAECIWRFTYHWCVAFRENSIILANQIYFEHTDHVNLLG